MPYSRLLPLAIAACLAPAVSHAQSATPWSPKWTAQDGTQLTFGANFAWDISRIDDGPADGQDAQDWRRREVGMNVGKPGVYDINVIYDLENKIWLDAAVGVETAALFGRDLGRLRLGNIKTPGSMEGVAPNRHTSLMENSVATQAYYIVGRAGLTWSIERPRYLLNVGAYNGDFLGNNTGGTQLVNAAWTPFKSPERTVHLGMALVRETPEGDTNGLGQYLPASARFSTRTGASLSPQRLIDTGVITGVEKVNRQNLQALWIEGPLSLQGEYYWQQTRRADGLDNYHSDGHYLTAGWLSGNYSRMYRSGTYAGPRVATGKHAVEVLARHSQVDLDHDSIAGGHVSEWTVGGNLYVGPWLKFQANYTRSRATNGNLHVAPRTFGIRSQIYF